MLSGSALRPNNDTFEICERSTKRPEAAVHVIMAPPVPAYDARRKYVRASHNGHRKRILFILERMQCAAGE